MNTRDSRCIRVKWNASPPAPGFCMVNRESWKRQGGGRVDSLSMSQWGRWAPPAAVSPDVVTRGLPRAGGRLTPHRPSVRLEYNRR